MRTAMVLLLFVLGLFLAFLVFPVALYVSAGLGYALGVASMGLGAYMIVRREGRVLPAVLGVVLCLVALVAVGGTALVHMSAVIVEEALEEAAERLENLTGTETLHARLGSSVRADGWVVRVEDVREASVILYDSMVCRARPGYKVVIVRLSVGNAGGDVKHLSDVWGYTLVTNTRKSYSSIHPLDLEIVWNATRDEASGAERVEPPSASVLPPGTHTEYDVLFEIPVDEKPRQLVVQIGFIKQYVVTFDLSG